ncbi:ABC transporter permease [Stutzerimonas stutzeri]|uniref:ABC transporter permease n=1 Tax=Stutzerimonas stutzeri TaxID=316 RepID=W8R2S0_STUST|nr:iron ABC transporter permease [Stutzerimonas stutzeri]AHL76904.1 ABC transporter permease [Stutzerimonas stutzeri]
MNTITPSPLQAPPGHWLVRIGGFRLLVQRRGLLVGLGLTVALAVALLWLMAAGTALTPWQALQASLGNGRAALGAAGCLLQTLARNRLATPGVIGIDDGATALPTSLAPPMLALSGATTAAVLTFALAMGAGGRGYNLLLARADIDAANAAYPWTVGSLNARPAQSVWLLAIGVVVGLPLAKLLGHPLASMRFSDNVATGLGIHLSRMRVASLALTVWLTALAVAVVGPVGLTALVAPETARYLCRQQGVPILNSALAGALLMLIADWAGRTLLAPVEIPVGIIMAIIGGPYLLWILLRQSSRTLS